MFQIHCSLGTAKKSQYRCESCTESHLKCDRNLPNCSNCIRKSLECVYFKKVHNKLLYSIEGDRVNYKVLDSEKKQKDTDKNKQILVCNKNKGRNKFRITKLPEGYNSPYMPIGIFNRFYRKDAFENMMTLFQFPSPFKNNTGLNLFLDLSNKLNLLAKKYATKKPLMKVVKREVFNLEELRNKAIDNYFKYNNVIFPIFIQSKFNFDSKSEILKKSIILVGISYIEKDETIDYLTKYLSFKLETLLKIPHNIQPTLENIQALIILMGSSKIISFLRSYVENHFSFCLKASDLIGLHQAPKGLSKNERIERDMTYSSLFTLHHFWRICSGNYLYLPYRPSTLDKEFKLIKRRILNPKVSSVVLSKGEMDYYFSLIMSSYNNELSSLLFSLRLLKEKYLTIRNINQTMDQSASVLIKRIKSLRDHYLILFSKLNIKTVRTENNSTNFNFLNHILFNYYYLMFYVYSLNFYYSDKENNTSNLSTDSNDIDYTTETLLKCQATIHHGINIPYQYMSRFNLANLSQCLIFILRYKDNKNINLDDAIQKGIDFLKSMSKIEGISGICVLNMYLIDFVKKKLSEYNASKEV